MRSFNQGRNDQNNQLLLTGRQQAYNELLTERNQPLNEIAALMSGSQVRQPTFASTPQSNVANVDYAGLVNAKHQADMAAWQAEVNSQNAMMGGLFGLGGTLGAAALKFSDPALKTDVEKVGRLDNGLPVYRYRYRDGGAPEIGLMADDVARQKPGAVACNPEGLMAVDYVKATARKKGRRHG